MPVYLGESSLFRNFLGNTTIPYTSEPPNGSTLKIAHIGDSTSYQSGTGEANVKAAFVAAGWDPDKIYFWGVGSKTLTGTDANGKTTFQNIDDARVGGEPDVWVINLGANNAPSSDSTNGNLLGQVLDKLGPTANVKWCGISQADAADATVKAYRARFNRLARTMVDLRPNMEWFDWHAWIKGYNDAQYWVSDTLHMTQAGYAIKNQFFAAAAGRPSNLAPILRKSGPGYQRYEDLYTTGDTLQQVVNKVQPGNILTFPAGTFQITDFNNGGSKNGVRIGTDATGQICRGFSGTVDANGEPLTIIQMAPMSSTKTPPTDAGTTNGLMTLQFWKQDRAVVENIRFEGTDQGHDYGGVGFAYCKSPTVRNIRGVGMSQGSANYPPGETFGINFAWSPNATLRDSEFDGRRNGVRVGASPFGWNTTENAYVRNVYCHHGKTGMGTWWETTGIHTVDYRTFSTASGSGVLNGAGLNHEKVGGVIRHIRTNIGLDRAGGNTGFHIGLNNSSNPPAFGNADDVRILSLTHDAGISGIGGGLMVHIAANYHGNTQTQTSNPYITLATAPTTPLTARDYTDQSNPSPTTQYWIWR